MAEHIIPDLSEQQRANLRTLSAYLKSLPADYPKFAMATFTADEDGAGWDKAHLPECGTAACAAGHGPSAGIHPFPGETWTDYSERAFVSVGNGWSWCFAAEWSDVDNTAHGAAARIDYMLANGVPYDSDEQAEGLAPLSYEVPA